MKPIQFSAAGCNVQVVSDSPLVHETLRMLTGTYPPPRAHQPTLAYRCETEDSCTLWCDGEPLAQADQPVDLPPLFELDLYRRLLALPTSGIWLHAAAVAFDSGALVLVGPSGAGKTTLARALTSSGARYISDEHVRLAADSAVTGLCRPLTVEVGSRVPKGWRLHTYDLRQPNRSLRQETLVHPPTGSLCHLPEPLSSIVLIAYHPSQPTQLTPVSPSAALAGIWPHAHQRCRTAFDAAVAAVSTTATFRLQSRSVDDACAELAKLCA